MPQMMLPGSGAILVVAHSMACVHRRQVGKPAEQVRTPSAPVTVACPRGGAAD